MFTNQTINQETLPAITIRGIVPLPNNEIRLDVGKVENQKAIKAALDGNKFIVLLAQKQLTMDNPKPSDINEIGVVGDDSGTCRPSSGDCRFATSCCC